MVLPRSPALLDDGLGEAGRHRLLDPASPRKITTARLSRVRSSPDSRPIRRPILALGTVVILSTIIHEGIDGVTRDEVWRMSLAQPRPLLDLDPTGKGHPALPVWTQDHSLAIGDRGSPLRKGASKIRHVRDEDRVPAYRRLSH